MPKSKAKSQKGTIAIDARGGMLRIRFRHQGSRIERALGIPDSPDNRRRADAIAKTISAAIANNKFSLDELPTYLPNYCPPPPPPPAKNQLELFDEWCEWLQLRGTSADTIAGRYASLRSHLRTWGPITTPDDAQRAINTLSSNDRPGSRAAPCSPSTVRSYLSNLSSWGRWLLQRQHISANPWIEVAPPKGGRDPSKRKAFTLQEVAAILTSAQTPLYRHCYPYIATLLYTGMRPSEVIGLRWRDVNLTDNTITITSSLVRSRGSKNRVRKRPKTGVSGNRILEILPALQSILGELQPGDPDQLLFTGRDGKPIDDSLFAKTDWRGILGAAGCAHRPPYACRHTYLSHLVDRGQPLPKVAAIAGHSGIGTLTRTYLHAVNGVSIDPYETD
jgi:integrase